MNWMSKAILDSIPPDEILDVFMTLEMLSEIMSRLQPEQRPYIGYKATRALMQMLRDDRYETLPLAYNLEFVRELVRYHARAGRQDRAAIMAGQIKASVDAHTEDAMDAARVEAAQLRRQEPAWEFHPLGIWYDPALRTMQPLLREGNRD